MVNKVFKITKLSEEIAQVNNAERVWWTCHLVEVTDKAFPQELHLNISKSQFDELKVEDRIRIKDLRFSTKQKQWQGKVFFSNSIKLLEYEKVALFDPDKMPPLFGASDATPTSTGTSYMAEHTHSFEELASSLDDITNNQNGTIID